MRQALAAVLCLVLVGSMLYSFPGRAHADPGVIAKSISVTDTAGNARKTLAARSDFVAVVQIANGGSPPRRYVAIIDVIDATSISASLDLRNSVLGLGQMASASSALRLGEGDYSLYTFSVDDDKNPQSFSPVVSSPVSISKIDYLGIYVPMYKYPDLSNPDGIWNALFKAKHDHNDVLFVVTVNPSSGPSAAQSAAYASAISALKKSGAEYILEYVPTYYAVQDTGHKPADLKDMMDRYRKWYIPR